MMPRIKIAHLAVIATLMPGCMMVGPDYKRPEANVPPQYSTAEPVQVSNEAEVSNTWWQLYQDPILNDLVEKALKNNTDIKLAVAKIEESDAYLREVGAALFPEIDFDGSGSRSRISQLGATPLPSSVPPVRNNFSGQIGTNFELDFWGRLRRLKEAARAQALSTRYAKDTVDLSLKGLVVTNYLLLRSLEAQVTLTEDSLKSREESLGLTKRRLQGGVSSGLDVEQAQVASSNLIAQVADLKRQRDIAEHQLAVLTGDLALTIPEGTLDSLPIPPVPPVGLPSSLLAARPDIRQSEASMIAANANIGVAKAALFPTISLTANYGGQSADLSDILKSAARIWTGGLSVNLPIFDSGRLDARVDQATAKQKQALASYESSIQTGFKEVSDALVTLSRASDREAALQNSKDASKRALSIAENRYKSGYSGYLDVLDSQRTYNDAALAYIQSRQARLSASVDLFKALGGGWKDPQQQAVAKQ